MYAVNYGKQLYIQYAQLSAQGWGAAITTEASALVLLIETHACNHVLHVLPTTSLVYTVFLYSGPDRYIHVIGVHTTKPFTCTQC